MELKYARFHYAAPTATGVGLNDFYEMSEDQPGVFIQRKGRIGITVGQFAPRQVGGPLPMTEWDNVKQGLIRKGWVLFTERRLHDKKVTKKETSFDGQKFKPEEDERVSDILRRLWMYSNKETEESYTYRAQDIPQEMLDKGTQILADLRDKHKGMSEAAFNAALMQYFAYVPRRMKRLVCTRNAQGRTTLEKMENILKDEEDKLAFLLDQIKTIAALQAGDDDTGKPTKTATELFGLEWSVATPAEEEYVKSLMDDRNRAHVLNIWKVRNLKTSKRFDDFCSKHGFTEDNGISHLWHGSPAQNWWSISANGLWLKPGLNGGMFGPGLYFAPESDKSVGYTGFGCWRGEGSDNGFLALNKVATGKPFWYYEQGGQSSDMCLTAMKRHGTDCLWAHSRAHDKSGNSTLYRDEVIIYDDAQTTMEYLVEVQKH